MKKTALLTTLAFGLMGLAAAESEACKGHGKGHGKGDHGAAVLGLLKKAGVKEDVVKQIRELHDGMLKAKAEVGEKIAAKKKEIHAALAAATIDQAKVDALAGEVATLKGEKVKLLVGFVSKAAGLLSAEERAKVFSALDKMGDHKCKCKGGNAKGGACKH